MNSSTSSSNARPAQLLATIVAGFLALIVGSELMFRTMIAPEDMFLKHVQHFATALSPDAAFGDSHVARGFAGGDRFVNLAFPSEGIEQIVWKARTYYAGRSPGRVILQADPHLFAAYRLRGGLGAYPAAFRGAGKSAPLYVLDPAYRAQMLAYWWAVVKSGGRLHSDVTFDASGALLSAGDLSREEPRLVTKLARGRIIQHIPAPGFARRTEARLYADLVADLRGRDAQVCLVTFPVSAAFNEALSRYATPEQRALYGEAIAAFKKLAADTGARYVDHRAIVAPASSFRDVDHLNAAGAAAYADKLRTACFG